MTIQMTTADATIRNAFSNFCKGFSIYSNKMLQLFINAADFVVEIFLQSELGLFALFASAFVKGSGCYAWHDVTND